MYKIYTNQPDCPYCLKAKELLTTKNLKFKYELVSKDVLKVLFPTAETVPQITYNDALIGGFDKLITTFEITASGPLKGVSTKKKKNVFNAENTGYITGHYPLFFGEDLGFVDTINTPYPILDELYQSQMSQIWNEFEIDLTQDRQDMLTVPRPTTDLSVLNLLWQTLVDSVANRAITGTLMAHVTNSDLEAWYNAVALFETIHARTYSHIIKQTFVDPQQALRDGYANKQVIARAKSIVDAFNAVANIPHDASEAYIKETVYLALIALYTLETVNFMSSFGVTFGIAETGVFAGISQDVTLICRDEILHAKGGREILKIQLNQDRAFINSIMPKIETLLDNIEKEERDWNDYLFSEGRQCIGINAPIMKEYVKYRMQAPRELFGIPHEKVDKDPLPFMKDYTDSSNIQVAAQELQLTSYLVNAIQAVSEEEITNLTNELSEEFEDFLNEEVYH